jgi:hypothetical protein
MQMNVHEDFSRAEEHEGPSNRSFGVTVGVFLVAVAVVPLLRSKPVRWWAVVPAAMLLIAAALFPSALSWPNRAWMKLALLLSKITNPIVTALMFYLLFAPIGVFCRWTGKDLLRLKRDDTLDTYWIARQPVGPPPETMRNQF